MLKTIGNIKFKLPTMQNSDCAKLQSRMLNVGVQWVKGEQVTKYTALRYYGITKEARLYAMTKKEFDKDKRPEVHYSSFLGMLENIEAQIFGEKPKAKPSRKSVEQSIMANVKPKYIAYLTLSDAKKALGEIFGQNVKIVSDDFFTKNVEE